MLKFNLTIDEMKEYLKKKWRKYNELLPDEEIEKMYNIIEYLNCRGYGSSIKYLEIDKIKEFNESYLKRNVR